MPMEPDLYRALRAKDLGRVRECLRDWGKENRRVWWAKGGAGGAALTPLHVGAKGSSQDILRELLKHPEIGRSINTFTDKTNVTPLHEAAGSSSPEVIRLLLDAGADISSCSGDLSTAFHIACSRGRPETCVELLRRGSLLEARDAQGMTPLLRAAANGRAEVTKWLLEEGADPAAVDIHHNTALALSCRATGRLDAARALLDAGADVLEENADGSSCVSLAAISGRTELLDMMLAAMACSGQRFRDGGGNVLYDAVDHGLGKVVKLLTSVRGRELGISINRSNPDKQGTTPLHAACFRGQQAIVTQLLSRGAQPDAADENGLRALHVACANPDSEAMVRSLLKAKANPNITDDFGCSPIYYAFVRGNDDIVKFMLSNGASLFRMDFDQALRIACFYGKIIEVESLLWMEADSSSVLFNHRDRGTAFHPTVNPAVRDGINDLLSDSSGVDAAHADEDSRRSTGGGAAAAAALKAAREAAAAWGGDEGHVGGECASPTKTMASSASTSTGWASGGDSSSFSMSRDIGDQDSSVAGDSDSGRGGGCGGDEGEGAPRRVRPSFGLGREDLASEDEEDDIGSEDDAFVMPSMLTLENDLIRQGSFYANGAGDKGNNNGNNADAPLASTGAVAALRRFGQRVREGVTGSAVSRGSSEASGSTSSGGNSGSVSQSNGNGNLKDKARAKFAGVIKWAQSPRRMAMSPRGRAGASGFAG
eukprot:g5658.t1